MSQDDLNLNIILRLIGSSLCGKLRPDYSQDIMEYGHLLEDFVPTLDPGYTKFLNKMMTETRLLVDDILNAKW